MQSQPASPSTALQTGNLRRSLTPKLHSQPEIPERIDDEAGQQRRNDNDEAGGVEDDQPPQIDNDEQHAEQIAEISEVLRHGFAPRDQPGKNEHRDPGDAEGQQAARVDLIRQIRQAGDIGGRRVERVGEVVTAMNGCAERADDAQHQRPQQEGGVSRF
jgi:hypothetical protein